MLELFLCSLFTIVPDYLYRRYRQGKRIGHEITLFSVWYVLRYGITGCLMLTVLLITVIFYYHPSTTTVNSLFRTVPILPEASGRVSEIFVQFNDTVKKDQPIFKLDSSRQEAALEVAKRRLDEIDARMVAAKADILAAEGQVQQSKSAETQALDELRTKQELARRNPGNVAPRDIEKLEVALDGRKGTTAAADAARQAAEIRLATQLPAEKASAQAALQQAQVDLDKTTVYAGVSGRVEQFILRVGDVVNPFMRPAGILIPDASRSALVAGFNQIEAQVMKVGMAAEATCVSKPLTIIPMVVTDVQDFIAAGQIRAGEALIDVQQTAKPGTITVILEPLYPGGLDGVTRGSLCIANAYTNSHDRVEKEKPGLATRIVLHGVDAVGLVHAMILRIQALMLPIKVLVFSGH